MAKVKCNKFIEVLSGKFGNIVFRQMKDGTTVVAAAPDFSNRVFSEAQPPIKLVFSEQSPMLARHPRPIPYMRNEPRAQQKTPNTGCSPALDF